MNERWIFGGSRIGKSVSMQCPVCRRSTIWIRKESGRKVLVDSKTNEGYYVTSDSLFDPSIHQDHALTCYVPYSRSHKYSIKQVETIGV